MQRREINCWSEFKCLNICLCFLISAFTLTFKMQICYKHKEPFKNVKDWLCSAHCRQQFSWSPALTASQLGLFSSCWLTLSETPAEWDHWHPVWWGSVLILSNSFLIGLKSNPFYHVRSCTRLAPRPLNVATIPLSSVLLQRMEWWRMLPWLVCGWLLSSQWCYATPGLLHWCWHPPVLVMHSEHDTMELFIMSACASWQEKLFLIV